MLLTLSVVGRVELTPADPLDARVAAAFNAHQRRATERRPLLGPDAVGGRRRGVRAGRAPRCWCGRARGGSGAAEAALTAEWLAGWVGAACEQQPDLAAEPAPTRPPPGARRRPGELAVTVGHADLLVLPMSAVPR